MNKTKLLNFDHILAHASFQALAGIYFGFGVYMLTARGFNSAVAGVCLGLANGLALILEPIISNYLDNTKKTTVFEMIAYICVIVCALYLANHLITNPTIFLCVVFVLAGGLFSSLEPLFNSLSTVFSRGGVDLDFGSARACGSFSYGVVCALFGPLSDAFSYRIVTLGGLVFALLLTYISFKISNDTKKANIETRLVKEETISFKRFFKQNKSYIIVCICLTGVLFGYLFIDNFTLLVVERIGGTSADMGIILGIKALLEGIAMMQYQKVRKHFSVQTILKFSVFMFAAKELATCLASNIVVIYLAQVLQMGGFAFLVPGIVELVNINMDKKEAIRGHALFTMTIGLGSLLSSAIGGFVTESFGILTMEYVAFVVTLISAIGFTLFVDKVD